MNNKVSRMGTELLDGKVKNSTTQKTSWPIDFSTLRSPPHSFATIVTIIVVLIVLILLALAVISVARLAIDLLGADSQRASEAVKSLLPIAAAVIGLPLIIWRLVILNQQTQISEAKTQIDRETHYTSIFSRSVEQLGQTRIIYESRTDEEGLETTTKTAPNVEVRLGGIHSLTRLAEESVRDREKIESTLRAYVRENSWSDRDGTVSKLPKATFPTSASWSFPYRRGTEQGKKEISDWTSASDQHAADQMTWANSLSETRVDVREAIDAVASMRRKLGGDTIGRFYESLFVGQSLRDELLSTSRFERCAFVNCTFTSQSEIAFTRCRFLLCRFQGTDATIRIHRSDVIHGTFSDLERCVVEIHASEIYGGQFLDLPTFDNQ
jgi:hypothetical protein